MRRISRRVGAPAAAAIIMAALHVSAARTGAQEVTALWESDAASQYAWLNAVRIIPLRHSHSLVLGISATHIAYEYAEVGGFARIQSRGGALSAGYRFANDVVEATAQTGVGLRRTSWAPPITPREAWTEHGLISLAEAYLTPRPSVLVSAVVSYDGMLAYHVGRVGFQRNLTPNSGESRTAVWLGLDATVQGSSDERARQAGVIASLEFPPGFWFELRTGLGRWKFGDGTHDVMGYWSMAIVRSFD